MQQRITRTLMFAIAALMPCLPHLVEQHHGYGAILPLLCYGPLLLFLVRLNPEQAFVLGGLHGIFLVFFASGWVWSYPDLPHSVAITASIISGLVLGVSCLTAALLARLISNQPLIRLLLCSTVFVLFEYLRSFSHHFFLPLGSLGQGAAYPMFLPVAGWLGASGYSLLFLMLSASCYLCLMPDLLPSKNSRQIRSVACVFILLGSLLIIAGQIDKSKSEHQPMAALGDEILCAASDLERRYRSHHGYLDSQQIKKIANEARAALNCSLLILPEYTSLASREAPIVPLRRDGESTLVIAGVMLGERVENRQLFTPDHVTNSSCILDLSRDYPRCFEKSDKLYLAPFVESTLFHDLPPLLPLGGWLSNQLVGDTNLTRIEERRQSLSVPGFGNLAVITCLELFIPDLSSKIMAKNQRLKLIIAPTDLSAFARSPIILSQYQRAAALQAATSGLPLLFVSTEAVELYSQAGKAIQAHASQRQISAWIPKNQGLIQ